MNIQNLEVSMAKIKKVPLQSYLAEQERSDFIAICEKLDVSASKTTRTFIQGFIKKHKELLK